MQSRRFFLDKSKLRVILAALFIVFALLVTVSIQVSSQSKKDMKDMKSRDDCGNQRSDSKRNDGVQEFIDVLESSNEEISSALKINAIKRLGDNRVERAIPLLIKYLDYEDEVKVSRSKPTTLGGITVTTEQNDLPLSGRYPAIGALMQIGETALPVLVDVVEKEKLNSTRSKNARVAIQYIFLRGNVMDGILYLEKAASESKVPNGAERLQAAALEMRKIFEKLQE